MMVNARESVWAGGGVGRMTGDEATDQPGSILCAKNVEPIRALPTGSGSGALCWWEAQPRPCYTSDGYGLACEPVSPSLQPSLGSLPFVTSKAAWIAAPDFEQLRETLHHKHSPSMGTQWTSGQPWGLQRCSAGPVVRRAL